MKKTMYALLAATAAATAALLLGTAHIGSAQTTRSSTTTTNTQNNKAVPTKPSVASTVQSATPLTIPANLLTALPTSDIVASINMQRLLSEAYRKRLLATHRVCSAS